MSIQTVVQHVFSFFDSTPIVVEVSPAALSSDGGLLAFRELDERFGITRTFAAALNDPRAASQVDHTFEEMTRARIYGILAGYLDQNDHDVLRTDPIFKLIANRSPEGDDLASQPTLSRFENQIDIPSLKRLGDVVIDQFIASFSTPPNRLTLDFDAVDDPAHGQQQLVMFHGFYEQYQYLPLVVTCAENDQIVLLALRPGNVTGTLGDDAKLEYLVSRLRAVWPNVVLHIRADAGFGVPVFVDACERLGVDYSIGLKTNPVLEKGSAELIDQVAAEYEQAKQQAKQNEQPTPTTHRRVDGFWYRAGSWRAFRWVIVKAEANDKGTNRRYVLSNRPGAYLLPEAAYDDYAGRGEAENRNKEFKCDLGMDRLSDHRFMANLFRLYLHAAAHNLLVRMRQAIACPPCAGEAAVDALAGDPVESGPNEKSPLTVLAELQEAADAQLPPSARTEPARRRYFNKRRRYDPLGEGQANTWRLLFIKVAAEVVVSHRRVLVKLSSSWPYLHFFQRSCERLSRYLASLPNPA